MIASGNQPTVYLLNNDDAVCHYCERALSSCGYLVKTLNDGMRELDTVMDARPDAVIVDMGSPCHESVSLIHEIRAHDRQTAIIVIAANPTVRNAVDALQAGADEILPGPCSPDELRLTLAVALRQRRNEPR